MDKTTKSVKQSTDKKASVKNNKKILNVKINLNDSSTSDSIDKKLDSFINKVKDENVRANFFKKLDDHVNNLLDTFKIREKKRKNTKTPIDSNGLDKIDLTSSDSILTQINLKNVFNSSTFSSLPLYYQYKLVKLLPKCDQELTAEGWLNISSTALNNEYFTKAYRYWSKQLKESKLNSDFVQKCKADLEKGKQNLDPFKVKNFEPIWNKPLRSSLHFDELTKERLKKLNEKKLKDQENSNLKSRKEQALVNNCANNLKNCIQKKQTKKRNYSKPNNRQTNKKKDNSFQTPNKEPHTNPNQTSPLSVGSITVRKTIDTPSPINLSFNDQSPTNSKILIISNGKLLQLQNAIQNPQQISPQSTSLEVQNDLKINTRKRKIDLEYDNAEVNLVNDMNILNSINFVKDINLVNNFNQNVLQNTQQINSATCECEQKPLVNCNRCEAFCHQDCLNSSNLCNNCL